MGHGHSESIGKLTPLARRLLPDDTKYEAQWWDRRFRLDGYFHGPEWNKQCAFTAAKDYAERVSIGNLTTVRQFIEMSMRHSERNYGYVQMFPQMLNRKGRDIFHEKMKRFKLAINGWGNYENEALDRVIKLMLGYTRQRNLLTVEWADDSALWAT